MEKILITGGLGHIGSKLINDLKDFDITIVDNLSTQRYCSLFNHKRKILFIEKDFVELKTKFLNQFDKVLHLAAETDASKSFANEEKVWMTNVIKTKKFIDQLKKSTVKLFIFPSTTSVYGAAGDLVYEDNENALNPQSPYAKSKIEIEDYLRATKKMNYIILRLGTIFGASDGMRFHTAINKFCFHAAFNQPLVIWKQNYNQKRPYLGLEDFISALKIVIKNKDCWNQTYNLLSNNYTPKEIIEIIRSLKANIKVKSVDSPLLNQFSYEVSPDKIMKLGYRPKNNLRKEIHKTLKLLGA